MAVPEPGRQVGGAGLFCLPKALEDRPVVASTLDLVNDVSPVLGPFEERARGEGCWSSNREWEPGRGQIKAPKVWDVQGFFQDYILLFHLLHLGLRASGKVRSRYAIAAARALAFPPHFSSLKKAGGMVRTQYPRRETCRLIL